MCFVSHVTVNLLFLYKEWSNLNCIALAINYRNINPFDVSLICTMMSPHYISHQEQWKYDILKSLKSLHVVMRHAGQHAMWCFSLYYCKSHIHTPFSQYTQCSVNIISLYHTIRQLLCTHDHSCSLSGCVKLIHIHMTTFYNFAQFVSIYRHFFHLDIE